MRKEMSSAVLRFYEEGLEKGREEGMTLLTQLYGMLLKDDRVQDAQRVLVDKQYRDNLLREFFPESFKRA